MAKAQYSTRRRANSFVEDEESRLGFHDENNTKGVTAYQSQEQADDGPCFLCFLFLIVTFCLILIFSLGRALSPEPETPTPRRQLEEDSDSSLSSTLKAKELALEKEKLNLKKRLERKQRAEKDLQDKVDKNAEEMELTKAKVEAQKVKLQELEDRQAAYKEITNKEQETLKVLADLKEQLASSTKENTSIKEAKALGEKLFAEKEELTAMMAKIEEQFKGVTDIQDGDLKFNVFNHMYNYEQIQQITQELAMRRFEIETILKEVFLMDTEHTLNDTWRKELEKRDAAVGGFSGMSGEVVNQAFKDIVFNNWRQLLEAVDENSDFAKNYKDAVENHTLFGISICKKDGFQVAIDEEDKNYLRSLTVEVEQGFRSGKFETFPLFRMRECDNHHGDFTAVHLYNIAFTPEVPFKTRDEEFKKLSEHYEITQKGYFPDDPSTYDKRSQLLDDLAKKENERDQLRKDVELLKATVSEHENRLDELEDKHADLARENARAMKTIKELKKQAHESKARQDMQAEMLEAQKLAAEKMGGDREIDMGVNEKVLIQEKHMKEELYDDCQKIAEEKMISMEVDERINTLSEAEQKNEAHLSELEGERKNFNEEEDLLEEVDVTGAEQVKSDTEKLHTVDVRADYRKKYNTMRKCMYVICAIFIFIALLACMLVSSDVSEYTALGQNTDASEKRGLCFAVAMFFTLLLLIGNTMLGSHIMQDKFHAGGKSAMYASLLMVLAVLVLVMFSMLVALLACPSVFPEEVSEQLETPFVQGFLAGAIVLLAMFFGWAFYSNFYVQNSGVNNRFIPLRCGLFFALLAILFVVVAQAFRTNFFEDKLLGEFDVSENKFVFLYGMLMFILITVSVFFVATRAEKYTQRGYLDCMNILFIFFTLVAFLVAAYASTLSSDDFPSDIFAKVVAGAIFVIGLGIWIVTSKKFHKKFAPSQEVDDERRIEDEDSEAKMEAQEETY